MLCRALLLLGRVKLVGEGVGLRRMRREVDSQAEDAAAEHPMASRENARNMQGGCLVPCRMLLLPSEHL